MLRQGRKCIVNMQVFGTDWTHCRANWDLCAIVSIMAISVLYGDGA